MEARTEIVNFCCTQKEEEELMKLAKACGLSRVETIRRKIFFLPDKTCPYLKELKDTKRDIAGKIDQVLRSCQFRHFITTKDYKELRELLLRLDESYGRLIQNLKGISDGQFAKSIQPEKSEKRKIIYFRCNKKEEEELSKLAKTLGLSRSETIRRRIFFLPDPICLTLEELEDSVREIAAKINQVIRCLNARHFISTEDYRELRDLLSGIDEKYAKLIQVLKEFFDRQFIESILLEKKKG